MNINTANHDLFDTWNEISAYVFGFWFADGWIGFKTKYNGRKFKILGITNTDLQIMERLSTILNKNLTIKKPKTKRHKIQYEIRISSDTLFDFCYAIVGTTHKSGQQCMVPNIPDKYLHHFVRGFFDGDGSIYYKTYKNRHGKQTNALGTSFTAGNDTRDFLQIFLKKLRTFIKVGKVKVTKLQSRKLVFNQYDSMLLCEWMYKDATIYMERKKAIWDAADKTRLMNSKKYFSNKV